MPSILPSFDGERNSPRDLFREPNRPFEQLHLALFQSRKNINLSSIVPLMLDLPYNCFLAGGFMKSLAASETPNGYDIFFGSRHSFQDLVRRIQNAPETSFLHGYTSEISMHTFAGMVSVPNVKFTHPSKPPLNLIRVRWYDDARQVVDKVDLSPFMFAIDTDLNVTFSADALRDLTTKAVRINKLIFNKSTAIRFKKLIDAGYTYQTSGNYGNSWKDELLGIADRAISRKETVTMFQQ